MSGSMTPEREAELRAKAPFLKNGDKLIEALDAMAYERARADAAEAKLARVRELCRFQSSSTAHVVIAELNKP